MNRWRMRCPSAILFALMVAVLSAALHNWSFWQETTAAVPITTPAGALFLASLLAVLVLLHAIFLLLFPRRLPMQMAAAALVVLGAVLSYFTSFYGTVIDRPVVRGMLDTDVHEIGALLSVRLALYVLVLGLIPAALIMLVRLPPISWKRDIWQRTAFAFAGLFACGTVVFTLYSYYAPFIRAHKPTLAKLTPDTTLIAVGHQMLDVLGRTVRFAPAAESDMPTVGATRGIVAAAPGQKPLLMFLVIGETARAANFQLGGYGRTTNPELSAVEGLLYFSDVSSCGTATAVSVPCLFSYGGRKIFRGNGAGRSVNLLDSVAAAGFEVEWRDNNTGSQGVAERIKTIRYNSETDPRYCEYGPCFDEIMQKGLDAVLNGPARNRLIVFHQLGSHGPSYWQRYPAEYERFTPACRTSDLWLCSPAAVVNTYDNTIVYTDHVLARQIGQLKSISDRYDSILIYVSDHGESLGEKGLFLHGAPYRFAPREQTHVPLIMWMSDGYRARFALRDDCLRGERAQALSHDNVYHTVLGALGLANDAYRRELDLVAPCASGHDPR